MMDRAAIADLIPHAGSMVLLDAVVSWTGTTVHCTSRTHLRPTHPLRSATGLSAIHAIEYMAQAAAVHGALLQDNGSPPRRLLAAVRDVRLAQRRLDEADVPLEVRVRHLEGDARAVVYAGTVEAGAEAIASARLTLVTAPQGAP